ncbi:MAG: imidazole glycerol phosphate synthase subunit HisH [Candidatus Ancillula sp.]|nr:imidazole glycerol phosphate synthase subunit HisH [Candidatus Ancillula sp.]
MKKSVVIFDYGFGNVRSCERAFLEIGCAAEITNDYQKSLNCDLLVVPGVGAFGSCLNGLKKASGDQIIEQRLKSGKPIFGICVGFQILFQEGTENIESGDLPIKGLGYFEGTVGELSLSVVPHMGWNTVFRSGNSVNNSADSLELNKEQNNEQNRNLGYFYFVHSYGVQKKDFGNNINVFITKQDGCEFISAIADKARKIYGTQFHPEKSGENGLKFLKKLVADITS